MSRFVIYNASAGSGKTYTLVRQYIEIAISSKRQVAHRFEHILAITFTNKAANGMKERILSTLRMIVHRHPKVALLATEIASHLHIDSDEVVARCETLQSAILHNYTAFAVCTIDSFVHRIVRTFAHDLNLPVNFGLYIDNDEILQWSVDDLLSLVGMPDEESLTQLLCAYAEDNMESDKNFDPQNSIAELSKQIFEEGAGDFLARLEGITPADFININAELVRGIRGFKEEVQKAAGSFIEACKREGLGPSDLLRGVYNYMNGLANGDMKGLNSLSANAEKAFSNGNLSASKVPADVRARVEQLKPFYNEAYSKVMAIREKGLAEYNSKVLLHSNLFSLAVLEKVNRSKNRYYEENQIVHISEFNKRIAQEVADEPAPFIYERIGTHYHNYLIDEFQDTSRLQWHNFLPLMDEAMTYDFGNDCAEVGTQSLVVGDGKQAIYRFRQGDVRQFMMLPDVDDTRHGHMLPVEGRKVNLKCNFRTKSEIVDFNNRLFEYSVTHSFIDNEQVTKLYMTPDQDGEPLMRQMWNKKGGYVEVQFVEVEDCFESVLKAIRHQVDDMGYNYNEIMVLARDNKMLSMLSDYIMENAAERPVPMVSSESFLIGNSVVVRFLQLMLRHLDNRSDREAAAQVCEMLFDGDKREEALWQLRDNDFNLERLLNACGFVYSSERLLAMPLYDLCEELLRVFHLQGRDTAYVATLLNLVSAFVQRTHGGLSDLVKYLEKKMEKASSSTSPELDAVRLMTIHKAKGLESKVVIYLMPKNVSHPTSMWVEVPQSVNVDLPVAYVTKNDNDSLFGKEFDEETTMSEMDELNVFYVAMTRPEDKLVVICGRPKKFEGKVAIALLHDFVTNDSRCRAENDCFIVGSDDAKATDSASGDDESESPRLLNVNNNSFPSWTDRILIASHSEGLLSTLNLNVGHDYVDPRRYGIVVHDIMSQIATLDDVDDAVRRYGAVNNIDSPIVEEIAHRINEMMMKEENRRYFAQGAKVLCEQWMMVDGELERPDRVVVDGDRTWVVDFKTGEYDEKRHGKYLRQVDRYADALRRMGYQNVEPVIIYL